jgi:hypothetical protein
MENENLNKFYGICFNQQNEFITLWLLCQRGSLEDVVYNPDLKISRWFCQKQYELVSFIVLAISKCPLPRMSSRASFFCTLPSSKCMDHFVCRSNWGSIHIVESTFNLELFGWFKLECEIDQFWWAIFSFIVFHIYFSHWWNLWG